MTCRHRSSLSRLLGVTLDSILILPHWEVLNARIDRDDGRLSLMTRTTATTMGCRQRRRQHRRNMNTEDGGRREEGRRFIDREGARTG